MLVCYEIVVGQRTALKRMKTKENENKELFPFIAIHKLLLVSKEKGYLFYAFRKQSSIRFLGEIFLIRFQDHQCNF